MNSEAENIQTEEEEGKRRILIIDDDEFTLTMLEAALRRNYDIRLVSHGTEAIQVASEYFPNLIILDLNMPNVDGFEVLTQFKSHPFLAAIPVLCISGDKSLETRKHVHDMGAAGYLVKPISSSQIQSDIDLLLRYSNQKVESEDRHRSYFIAYNTHEKEKHMRKKIKSLLKQNKKVLVISLASGSSFCTEDLEPHLKTEMLFYLQMKGNILAKMPFMEELTPIIYDLEDVIGQKSKEFYLIFDDPDIIFNIYESTTVLSHVLMFSEIVDRSFNEVTFFSKRPISPEGRERLNRLANLMTGNI